MSKWNMVRAPQNCDGASSVEYGLLVAGIAAVILAMVLAFGGQVTALFDITCDAVASTSGEAC